MTIIIITIIVHLPQYKKIKSNATSWLVTRPVGPLIALNLKLFFAFPVIFILPRIVTRYHATSATPFVDDEGIFTLR